MSGPPATLRDRRQIAQANGRRLTVIPLPTRLTYVGLRSAEIAGLTLSFHSDSLLSLANPIGLDDIAALQRLPVAFAPLTPELWRPDRQERWSRAGYSPL